jgi:hypothetical protein
MKKTRVTFYLREPYQQDSTTPKKIPVPIMVQFTAANGQRFRRSTGLTVRPDYWNLKRRRVIDNKPGAASINTDLDQLEANIRAEVNQLRERKRTEARSKGRDIKPVRRSEVEQRLDILQSRAKPETLVLPFFYKEVLERSKDPEISAGTIVVYKKMLSLVEDFAKSDLSFDDISIEYFKKFNKHLVKAGYSVNYRHRMLSYFKTFLCAGLDKTPPVHDNYAITRISLNKHLQLTKEKSDNVYLNPEELHRLYYQTDLSASPYLERQRDVMIVGCLTGLRLSDWKKVDLNEGVAVEVDGFEFLQVVTQKTGAKVYIPLMEQTKEILSRYGGRLPLISEQKTREYFREVAKRAGLNDMFLKVQKVKGEYLETKKEKYHFVSTHTCRRSFISIAKMESLPDEYFELLTGHSSGGRRDSMIDHYNKLPAEERLRLILPALRRIEDKVRNGGKALLKTIHKAS